MKKILLCLFMALFILSSLCLCAFATDETTSVEYADWFGSSNVLTGYTVSFASYGTNASNISQLAPWLVTIGADSLANAKGSFSVKYNGGTHEGKPIWSDGTTVYSSSNNVESYGITGFYGGTITVDGSAGRDDVSSLPYAPTVTDIYSSGEGFVSSGFTTSIGIVGSVLGFVLGSPLLAVIGLSVGVFLIGWGITSVKDLIKGY